MRVLSGLLFLSLYLSYGDAFIFSLREKAKEPPEKVPCGAHSRVRPNFPMYAHGWLANKWLWLFFVIVLYMILKFRGHSGKTKAKEQNLSGLRGSPFRSPLKKKQHGCSSKNHAFTTLTSFEKDLVQFLSKVRNLKAVLTTGNNTRVHSPELPVDPQNCVTIYEVWGEMPE
ncbi:PREDICTED: protein FAM209B [Chinchilla lanigera]|uniref:Protein FAM209B n=1 Tax=Chinchilla lanigera TaxID=34839 RepID=A0A8C2V0C1_CHILA|nr:PREDICTED: protein FAM209B [Chinchilla lanigera]